MNKSITGKGFLFAIFFFATYFTSAQQGQKETNAVRCLIKSGGKTYDLTPNAGGYFQRITGVKALATLPIELHYPVSNPNDSVAVVILDGGHINDKKLAQKLALSNEGKCSFDLHVSNNAGLFRVLVAKAGQENYIQVWVDHPDASARTLNTICQPCGNNKKREYCLACGFDPYDGNVSRDVPDLQIWSSVGNIPFTLMRYGNSRNIARVWQLSFHYLLFDAGFDSLGRAQIEVHYPEGHNNMFTQSTSEPNKWLPVPGVDKRIFQYGNNFFFQLANGHRYRFEKIIFGGIINYILRDFKDEYQNTYTVTYDTTTYKKRITEPGGRYYEYSFSPRSFVHDPSQVVTSDGRMVRYIYDTVNDGARIQIRLRNALYGDGTQSSYNYAQLAFGFHYALEHAIDPRIERNQTNIRYTYTNLNTGTVGLLREERNGVTNQVMNTLDVATEDRKILSANGRLRIFRMLFDQLGSPSRYADGVGAVTQYTYDNGGIGYLKTETDPLGRVTTYDSVSAYGNPIEKTYPDGSKEKWTRDSLDQVMAYTDNLGRVTSYTRDSRHRPTRIDYPDGTFETYTYNSFSQVLDHRKKNGCTELFAYDSRGLKTSFTDCDNKITAYSYDAADRLAMVTDARSNITRYEYNERGLLTKMTHPDNSFQRYSYDSFGNRDTTTNEAGKKWSTKYDEFRRPVTMTDPLNRTTTYSYDLPGGVCGCSHADDKPTKITLPSGRVTTFTYDVEWRKISETKGAGSSDAATTRYEYDLNENKIAKIDPRNRIYRYEYDVRDRRKAEVDPLNNRTEYTYDAVNNRLTVKIPDNGLTTYTYDNMNRPMQVTDPKAQVTKMQYDAQGNMTMLTDPKNNVYNYQYDALDRKTRMTYPGGSFEQYMYDAVDNLVSYTNRNGDVRTYTYNNRDRETLSNWSDATPDVSTTYDVVNRITNMTSSVSALTYTYDDANQLLSETQNIAGAGPPKTVTYTYNADGLRSTINYPGGTMISYDYTARNLVSSITADASPPLTTYSYDLNDNRTNKTLKNGTNTIYTYDDVNRTLSVDNRKGATSFSKYNYDYDNVDRRKFVQYDNARGDVYTYDAIDQVIDVKYDVTNPDGVPGVPTRTVNYIYDASGNRTNLTDNGAPTAYTSNNLNQYTNVGGMAVTNSTNGNLQSFDGWTYTYDAQNCLTKAQKGGTTADFSYDARNRCVKRIINGITTFFYYYEWNVMEERNAADVKLTHYVYGEKIDEILIKVSTANTVYYHYDDLGNTVQLTNTSGDVAEKYSYDVFGVPVIRNGAGVIIAATAFANRFLFTGREYFQEILLYDYRNRMYSAILGRFLQTDPIGFDAGDYNLYRYVYNDPINKTDPFGLRLSEKTLAANVWTAHIWFRIDDEKCTVEHLKDENDITGWTGVLLGWASMKAVADAPRTEDCSYGKKRICLDVEVIIFRNYGVGIEWGGVSAGGAIAKVEAGRKTFTECTSCCCPPAGK